MSRFINTLADYVQDEVRRALGPSDGQELRIFFSGPPPEILTELFDALANDGSFFSLTLGDRSIAFPVFVLDANAVDPDVLRSTRCTPNYLVKVRTSECPVFLALHPPNESSVLSLESATTRIGMTAAIEDIETWYAHPLISALIQEGLAREFGSQVPNSANDVVHFALEEAWRADESYKDHRNAWKVLRQIIDCDLPDARVGERMLATLGLPSCSQDDFGKHDHLKLLARLADLLENAGIGPALDQLQDQAEDEVRDAICHFRDHLLSRCLTASQFSSFPASYYRPDLAETGGLLPSWWRILTVDAWTRLLDASPDPGPQEGLRVVFTNTVVPPVRGTPVLLIDAVTVQIDLPNDSLTTEVLVSRAPGAKQLEAIETIAIPLGTSAVWSDTDVPLHDRYVRYQFSASGYRPVVVKCIVLDSYTPGVSLYSRNASKITPFKLNRKAKDSEGRKVLRMECELALSGIGSHQLDIFKGAAAKLGDSIDGYESDAGHELVLRRPINLTDEHHAVCVIETDEESYFDFTVDPRGDATAVPYRIWVTADDETPTGASSEFDRLLIEHRASGSTERVTARVECASSRVVDLQIWAIEDDESFHPLVLGPDYVDCWRKPVWSSRPVFSRHNLILDPRPPQDEFLAPQDLLEARRQIQQRFRSTAEQATTPVEAARLAELMEDQAFSEALNNYLRQYVAWLNEDYAAAAWMDVVSVHKTEGSGDTLEPTPYAILLSPLHPVRLAWQCQAQRVLKEALDKHVRCPAASVLDPHSFPDCVVLPCRTAAGRFDNQGFVALASTSDYWAVLWNKEAMAALSSVESVFNLDFGIEIEGLTTGFGVQQVVRSIEEVSRLSAAKATISVSIESDTNGTSSCNEGVYKWCSAVLGPDGDPWYDAGPKALNVYDHRPESLHPEQASLASLTASTSAAVKWFTRHDDRANGLSDLAIIAHLGVANPAFQVENLRAAIDPLGLTRWRVRRQLGSATGGFVAEARAGTVPALEDADPLQQLLLESVDRLEGECSRLFDSYVFAPRMLTIETALNSARYCAVSSATVDASCFFRGARGAYLWDYDLPPYARRAGENSGYYLLAKRSETMIRAVQSAVQRLSPSVEPTPEHVDSLLSEISRRGMPTLKRLTGGGATSLGEIGMLVALRILQPEFQQGDTAMGLAPVRHDDNTLTLLIPVDPFKSHIEEFQIALHQRIAERPDLLVASLRFNAGVPRALRITPIEVKARSSVLSQADRQAALLQAATFSRFLAEIASRSEDNRLWSIGWRSLIASWLDYGFRVYGQLDDSIRQDEWTGLHSATLAALMSGGLSVSIDESGRTMIVDQSNSSGPCDMDGDEFRETMVISHADAHNVIMCGGVDVIPAIRNTLGSWRLLPTEAGTTLVDNVAVGNTGQSEARSAREASGERPEVAGTSQPPAIEQTNPGRPPVTSDPPGSAGLRFRVGTLLDTFNKSDMYFYPGNTELNQLNVGIVGDLGTGKTQLVQSLLYQLRSAPESNRGTKPKVLIFDYKKDYSKQDFVEATGAKVISPFQIPLNVFAAQGTPRTQNIWLDRSKFFSDILDKIYSGIGPLQRQRIKQAVRDAYQRAASSGQNAPTIYDVFDAYTIASGGQVDSPYSIISDIVDGEYFVREQRDIVSFSDFLDGIVVIDLAAVGQDDRTKNMLVVVLLNMFYEHMLTIDKRPFVGETPRLRFVDTMLLVDEADNIMSYEFDVLKRILLQGREFGVGVILASQYLSHFKTRHENYLEPLLTWFIHKVPTITVKELEAIGLTRVDAGTADRIKALACHECLYKTYDIPGEFMRAKPFYELFSTSQGIEDAPRA